MTMCPSCQQPATKRHGQDGAGRQRFTGTSGSAFSGYRWPPDVILTAVRPNKKLYSVLQSDCGRGVIPEQLAIANVLAHHALAPVPGLLHDRPL